MLFTNLRISHQMNLSFSSRFFNREFLAQFLNTYAIAFIIGKYLYFNQLYTVMTYSCANLFNYLDQAYDAFYDKSCVDSQDMALKNLFFSPHFDADQRKKMLDVRQL